MSSEGAGVRHSERLKEVVSTVLRGMSDPHAARRSLDRGHAISHNPVNQARNGYWGRVETIRTLGMGIADLLLEHYGDEIEASEKARTDEAAAEWLLKVADEKAEQPEAQAGITRDELRGLIQEVLPDAVELGVRRVLDSMYPRPQATRIRDEPMGYGDDYDQAFQRLYREMKQRLEADRLPLPPGGNNAGGSEGLTAADAAMEIAELERVWRKHVKPEG